MSKSDERERMMDKKFRKNVHSNQLSEMGQARKEFTNGEMDRDDYLKRLTDHGLDEHTTEYVDNLLSPDFILSKISGAEKHEMKWLVREEKEKIIAMHPTEESPIQGEYRKFVYDDEGDALSSLSDREIQLLDMAVWDIFFRIARSVGGWQQQELSSQYRVSKVDDDADDDSGRLKGLFS